MTGKVKAEGRSDLVQRRVLLIGPLPPPVTGNALAFQYLVDHFRAMGIDASVINISPRTSIDGRVENSTLRRILDYVSVLPVSLLGVIGGRGPVYLTIAQSWRGFIRDAVFVLLSRMAGRKVIVHIHGGNFDVFLKSLGPVRRWCVVRSLSATSRVIVLSDRLRFMLEGVPLSHESIRVVPNGVPNVGRKSSLERSYSKRESGEKFRILFLSNLIESKGYLAVLRAAAILCGRHGNESFEFAFAGQLMLNPADDVEVSSLEQAQRLIEEIVLENQLSGVVKFLGTVVGRQKEALLEASDVMVLPTRYSNEGQPLCILEALQFGIPVVSCRYRAIPDMVIEGETGIFVSPDSPLEIANAIERLWANPAESRRMSSRCVEIFKSRFGLERHLSLMEAVIFGR